MTDGNTARMGSRAERRKEYTDECLYDVDGGQCRPDLLDCHHGHDVLPGSQGPVQHVKRYQTKCILRRRNVQSDAIFTAFRPLEEEDEVTGTTQRHWLPMCVYALFQLMLVALGLYKCSAMGLLPNDPLVWKEMIWPSAATVSLFLPPSSPVCKPCSFFIGVLPLCAASGQSALLCILALD